MMSANETGKGETTDYGERARYIFACEEDLEMAKIRFFERSTSRRFDAVLTALKALMEAKKEAGE